MAGVVFGDVANAIVSFFRKVVNIIIDAIKWLKQAILKLYDIMKTGMREAIKYERTLARETIRFLSRHEDLALGITFAILFDVMGVNS